ncbi:MAG: radical SAM protein [Candidatus Omnitrophota bacterium]
MVDVILIQPQVSFLEKTQTLVPNCPHLGILYLSSYIIERGFSVKFLDALVEGLSLECIRGILKDEKPKVVGITAMTQNIKGAVQLAKFLKETFGDNFKIVLGGPHVSADPEVINRFPYFDFCITGEADTTFPDLIEKIIRNNESIKGIFRGETPMDLDALPFPRRDIIDYNIYKKKGFWANAIFASRGCPYHCNFCSIPSMDKRLRIRSPRLIAQEIEDAVKVTGIKYIVFSDDALTVKKDFVSNLCEEILRLPFKIKWEAQSRINYIDRTMLRAMRRAGCYKLLFGIESGNEMIRNQVIKKGITDRQIIEVTRLCWQEDIEPDHYLMLGHPTETKKELNDTVNCPLRFKPNIIGVFLTMPLPGAPLFKESIEEGIVEKDVIDRYIKGEYGQGYQGCWPYYIPKGLSYDELIQAKRRAYKKFYFRLNYLFLRLRRDIISWTKIKRDIQEGISMLFRTKSKGDTNPDRIKTAID